MAETDSNRPEAEDASEEAAETGVQTTFTREGPCQCVIRIEADEEHLRSLYEEKLEARGKDAVLSGFRPGKAPQRLVARRFADEIKNDTLSSVADAAYEQAVQDNDLTVVAQIESPDIGEMDWKVGQPAHFEFKCEVLPEIEVNPEQYKGLKIQVPRLEVTEEARKQEMERFTRRLATWEPVKEGTIDWEDYVEAEVKLIAPDGGAAAWSKKLEFYPRSETIGPFAVPGIKAAVMDAKLGDTLELEGEVQEEQVEANEDLKALAGQSVRLKVKIVNVYRLHVPQVDDELAKKLGMENTDEIRSMVAEQLERRLEEQKKRAREVGVVDAVLDLVELEMPASLVERAALDEQRRQTVRALRLGATPQQAEEVAEKTAEQSQKVALRMLKRTYLLKKTADKERIYVLDSETQEQARAIAAREDWSAHRRERFLQDSDMMRTLTEEMREEKMVALLLENAQVEEIDPEEFTRRMRARRESSEQPKKDQ